MLQRPSSVYRLAAASNQVALPVLSAEEQKNLPVVKDYLPVKLFDSEPTNDDTSKPFNTFNLRFSNKTTVGSFRRQVSKIMTRELKEKRNPDHVVLLLFHRRKPIIMQRDVNNDGFEAYSYVPGEVLDPELCDGETMFNAIGSTTSSTGQHVVKGTISAFLTTPDWLCLHSGSSPVKNYWGKKQDELMVHFPRDVAILIMQYLSIGQASFRIRDCLIEEKLSARERRDKQLKNELNVVIQSGGDLKQFFDERYA